MSWKLVKRSMVLFIPLALIAAAVMFMLNRSEVENVLSTARDTENRIIETGRQRTSIALTSAFSDLMYLSNQVVLQDWLTSSDLMMNQRVTAEYLAFAKYKEIYNKIRIIYPDGHEGIRVNWNSKGATAAAPNELQDKSERYFFKATRNLNKGEVYISSLDLDVDFGVVLTPLTPIIRLSTPVFNAAGERKGVLVLNYLERAFLDRLKLLGKGGASSIWLVNSDGYWLIGPSSADEWAFMYSDRQDRRIDKAFPNAWKIVHDSAGPRQFMADGGLFTVTRVAPGAQVTEDNALAKGDAKIVDAPSWYLISFLPDAALAVQANVINHNFIFSYIALLVLLLILSLIIAHSMALLRTRTQSLLETEYYLRAAAERGMNGFFIFSANRAAPTEKSSRGQTRSPVLEYLNPLAERMIADTLGHLRGQPVEQVMRKLQDPSVAAAPADQEEGHEAGLERERRYRRVMADGEPQTSEYLVTAGPFSGHYLEEEIIPLPNGIAVSCRDITERRQIEDMKSEFVSTVSHELRTPLTAIRGALGLIVGGAAGKLPSDVMGMLSIAYNNCERLVRLINDILDIEKIEAGRMPLDMRQLAVAPFLRQAIDLNAEFAKKYNIAVVLEGISDDADANTVAFMADWDRLQQVMANLLSNAIKFSRPGGVVTVTWQVSNATVRVAVKDTGLGIPESFRSTIFQKFAQADGSDRREKGGTGLGLSIVKAIMEQMGGEIGFDSVEGVGTTFFFTLPVTKSPPLPPTTGQAEVPTASADRGPVSDAGRNAAMAQTKPRLLICEDEVDIANLLRMIVERGGFSADVTHDAAGAMAALRREHYSALILDLLLPDTCGITIVRTVRADPALRDMPIMVVSAKAEAGRRFFRGDAIGLVDWMVKPIDADRLVQAVGTLLRKKTAARILHIEDDADIAEVIKQSLLSMATVTSVSTLAEARKKLQSKQFDLVILDIGLPDGSGLDLLPDLVSGGPHPTPIILFSATEVPLEVSNQVGAVLVKSKTSEEKLLQTIEQLALRHNFEPAVVL